MMTASLRASATLAFFIPLRLAIFIAHLYMFGSTARGEAKEDSNVA